MASRAAQASVVDLRSWQELDEESSPAELLAVLLSHGESVREARLRATALLDQAGGVRGLRALTRTQLEAAGLSPQASARVRAAVRLGLHAARRAAPAAPLDAGTVAELFHPLLDHLAHEEMHVVMVDAMRRFRHRRRIASGGVAACSVFIKDILAPVVEARAHGVVLVHNHPSGASKPSVEDYALTSRVQVAAETLGIWLIDHLVVAEDGHASAMQGGGRWNARNG